LWTKVNGVCFDKKIIFVELRTEGIFRICQEHRALKGGRLLSTVRNLIETMALMVEGNQEAEALEGHIRRAGRKGDEANRMEQEEKREG
jgi:hypothetical protein